MLSIIIPCYNGSTHIKNGNIENVYQYMEELNIPYEIIVVNDGSTDNSLNLLNDIEKHNVIKVITYEKNQGKGYAIKMGMMAAKEDVLFMDIDLATQLDSIQQVLNNKGNYDIIIGSRDLKESIGGKNKPLIRNIMSFVSSCLVHTLGGVKDQKDTQCGFKYISASCKSLICEKQIVNRWAFDVEYLYIARVHHLRVLEIPVVWKNDLNSSVSLIKSSLNFINDLFKIRKNRKNY